MTKYVIINPFPPDPTLDTKVLRTDDTYVEPGSGGGGGTWGGITGTLADQTDVQAALDAKELAGAVATHAAAVDPHPGYLTEAAAATTYDAINAASSAVATHEALGDPHAQYLTPAEGNAAYDVLNAASVAVAAHEGAADPHPGYLTAAEGGAAYQPLDSDLTTIAANITAAGLAILDDANAAAQRTTLGLVAIAASGSATDLSAGTVPDARFPATLPAASGVNLTALNATNLASGTLPAARMVALTGDVTNTVGTVGTTIAAAAVTLAKMANLAQDQFIGRTTASTGVPETATITAAARTVLDDTTTANMLTTLGAQGTAAKDAANGYPGLSASSLVNPAQLGSGAAITTKFLRGDSTWQALAGGGDLLSTNNLSDVANAATARTNLAVAPTASPTFTGTVTLPAIAAGSASASSWPKFTAGTILTTAEAGAIELDANCFYLTTDDGNRGVVPVEHYIRADATRTFTSNTNQQAIFNSPASGTLTLETGVYEFEALVAMTSMSATSGNGKFSILGAGTATLAAILWAAHGQDVAAEGTAAAVGGSWHVIATQTAANIATAATGTALAFFIKGTFEVSVAGTIIPSFAQTTAAAAVVSIGSFFKCSRKGSTSMTSVGQWS